MSDTTTTTKTEEEVLGNPFDGMTDANGNIIGGAEASTVEPPSDEPNADELETGDTDDDQDVEPEDQLFDASDYEREDLAIPKVDGNQIDRIAVKLTGEVYLDRSAPADVALFNKLRLGDDVTLLVEAKCSAVAAKGATDRDGDLDVIVGQRSVKVHTVYVPAGQAT